MSRWFAKRGGEGPAGPVVGTTVAILAILAVAALAHPLRVLVLVCFSATLVVVRGRGLIVTRLLAAALPVSVALAWGALPAPASLPGDCTDPFAPVALGRMFEMAAVLAAAGALVGLGSLDRAALPFRRPSSALFAGLGIAAVGVAGASLLAGPIAAGPFFGAFALELVPGALVPALLFATSNAVAEEVAYRGVLREGLVRTLGLRGANAGQAAIFALAHSGPDFVGSPLPVMAAMFAGAFIAGEIVARNRSLLVPIVLHAAFDVPIFFYWACRIG